MEFIILFVLWCLFEVYMKLKYNRLEREEALRQQRLSTYLTPYIQESIEKQNRVGMNLQDIEFMPEREGNE